MTFRELEIVIRPWITGLLFLACLSSPARRVLAAEPLPLSRLAVVDTVEPGSLAANAGMRPDDVVVGLNGKRNPSLEDVLADRFDRENAGDTLLVLRREKETIRTRLPQGAWGCEFRADLPERTLERLREARGELEKGDSGEEGERRRAALVEEANRDRSPASASWLQLVLGKALVATRHWKEAAAVLGQLEKDGQKRGFWTFAATLETARALGAAGDADRAIDAFGRARALAEASGSELRVAGTMNALFAFEKGRGRLSEAKKAADGALAIQERLAPGSLAVARSLHNLGTVAHDQGDLATAEERVARALAIRQRLAPGSLDVASSLNFMAITVWNHGELAEAKKLFLEALAIRQRLAPGSLEVATSFNNLGIMTRYGGDLAAAQDYTLKAMAIRTILTPDGLDVAASLNTMGEVASRQGDLAGAMEYHRKALAIRARLAPDSMDVTETLNSLGEVADEQGDLTAAKGYFLKALAIRECISLDVGDILDNLGDVARRQGDLDEAQAFHLGALAIWEGHAPGHVGSAVSLHDLAAVAHARRDLAAARRYDLEALAIRKRLTPGSAEEAESLHSLGTFSLEEGELAPALDYFQRAVAALEAQKGKLGGGHEAAELFSARYSGFYRDLIELQLRLGKDEDAFHTLERFRARSLLNMLAERDLSFAKDAPPELMKEQRRADLAYDEVQGELNGTNPGKDLEKEEKLLSRLRELRKRQIEIGEKIKAASPRLASLQYPEPLDMKGAGKVLEPGTLLLSYCVGERATQLLALLDGKLSVHTLPLRREELTRMVTFFRRLLTDPGSPTEKITEKGRELHALLLKPAEKEIARASRLLVCPDGPLHLLPFSALTTGEKRYLIEEKPVSYAISATVYAETASVRAGGEDQRKMVAFGDPVYPGKERSEGLDAAVRYAARVTGLNRLPATRREVENLGTLFPGAGIFLGERATEEEAKRLGKGTPFIHFACHGILVERFPLNSGLALTIPEGAEEGKENGILQAWEIFEQLRLDADLVTLSACQTGLGKEMGGEGLIGLTRAFQYAGARSVLSSLWSVADESTSEFMKRFYTNLKEGSTKTEALRLAQISFLHLPRPVPGSGRSSILDSQADLSHPFNWAPFVLNGAWN